MFKNYLTIAIRNLVRQKRYAFINIFGLALGIACCILMALFIKHEWSFDQFHQNKDQLYRVITSQTKPNGEREHKTLFRPKMVEEIKDNVPGITHATTFMRAEGTIKNEDRQSRERVGLVGNDFLSMFTFPFIAGDATTALNRPNTIVISKTTAHKLFDIQSSYDAILGQSVDLNGLTLEITGIIADIPNTSSLHFTALIPPDHYKNFGLNYENGDYTTIHVMLSREQHPESLDEPLKSFAQTHLTKRIRDLVKWKDLASEDAFTLTLQPFTDVYWNTDIRNRYEASGNTDAVLNLWAIAGLILLIACSNFTTLSIANSTGRALEVGLRKVLGADRKQVMQQFWSEALVLSFIGLFLAVALSELFLPIFNGLIQKDLQIAYFEDGFFLLLLFLLVIVVGLLSGSYPATVLSRFQPISALKGETRIGGRSYLTRTLIVLQYTASIALMICIGVMIQQQTYMRTKNLGYDSEHILITPINKKLADAYKPEILKDPRIINATIADRAFTSGYNGTICKLADGTRFDVRTLYIDHDYLATLKIPLLKGRNFSRENTTDGEETVLINETLAQKLNMENPIGQILPGFGWNDMKPTIIGIVGDFHFDSLRDPIQPVVLHMKQITSGPYLLIRLQPGNIPETIAMLEKKAEPFAQGQRIPWSFLDDRLDRQYRAEQHWQQVLTYSAIFTLLISCLGLFGLASLAVSRRTKEIGIRKVLGATVPNLVGLLTRDFVLLLLIANIFAWPIAYTYMEEWLTHFTYHIDLTFGVFALCGTLAIGIALLTICTQTLKAARSNPVDALRYE